MTKSEAGRGSIVLGEDQRLKYQRLREELDIDLRFKSGMYEQVFALHQSVFVLEFDHDGNFLHINLLFSQFMRYEPDELAGVHLSTVLHEDHPLPLGLVRAMYESRAWSGQVAVKTKNDRLKWLTLTITPFVSASTQMAYKFVCVGFDSTSQRRQKDNLQKMIKQEKHYVTELEHAKADLEKKVEEKVLELKDSIRYSKRIQGALMPDKRKLNAHIPDQFNIAKLFRPRDLVSGDFYYSSAVHNNSILAVADATGHGIPGAFVSILGIGSLKKLIDGRGMTDPAALLTEIDKETKDVLNQADEENTTLQDSMEMSLLKMSPGTNRVVLSSAMMASYLVNADGVHDIKGARKPLGGTLYDDDVQYENIEFELKKGDTLYLLSDGYHTQLGGQDNKPLGKKRFREYLMNVNTVPSLEERLSVLEYFLENWMGPT
ncbi:MAG: SpoIIE family protein phosphatase, partial [Bacteroidota bacterium]